MTEDKKLEDLTNEEVKSLKIEFAPGAFDDFEGTQEELDELMLEITNMIQSGEFLEKSKPVNFDELFEDDPKLAERLLQSFSETPTPRQLQ